MQCKCYGLAIVSACERTTDRGHGRPRSARSIHSIAMEDAIGARLVGGASRSGRGSIAGGAWVQPLQTGWFPWVFSLPRHSKVSRGSVGRPGEACPLRFPSPVGLRAYRVQKPHCGIIVS